MALSTTSDLFLITAMLFRLANNDDTVVALYDVASVVPSACSLLTDDNDPSLWLTTGVVCPASVHTYKFSVHY